MSSSVSHGAATREPVYRGNRRIPGLYARTRSDGSTVYDVALRLGGKVRRHRLTATTKTDAIAELRALQTDYRRGEEYRSPAAAVTVEELVADFIRHMRTRGWATRTRSAAELLAPSSTTSTFSAATSGLSSAPCPPRT